MPMTTVFSEIVELAARLGVKRIDKMPGCWEVSVDSRWWIALNGHTEARKCSKGARVPALTCYVEYNGWPAGFVEAGGGLLCFGDAANEQAFIEALKASGKVK